MNNLSPNIMKKFTEESYKLGYMHALDMVKVLVEKEMKRKSNNGKSKRTVRKSPNTTRGNKPKTANR